MRKNIKIVSKYLLIILAAVIISSLTQCMDLYGRPQVTQPSPEEICNTNAFYKPSIPPQHDSGFPIPYITHYVADGGCGVGKPVIRELFVLNSIFWVLVLFGLSKAIAQRKE